MLALADRMDDLIFPPKVRNITNVIEDVLSKTTGVLWVVLNGRHVSRDFRRMARLGDQIETSANEFDALRASINSEVTGRMHQSTGALTADSSGVLVAYANKTVADGTKLLGNASYSAQFAVDAATYRLTLQLVIHAADQLIEQIQRNRVAASAYAGLLPAATSAAVSNLPRLADAASSS